MANEKITPKILPGFMELLPEDQIEFNSLVDKIRKAYENFGYVPLDTPIIELSEIILAKGAGDNERQVYRFNKGGSDLTLRFDLTVPLARYVSQYFNEIRFPFRRYQIGKVYRGEKPQKGRFREFYQCDIDIIGDGDLDLINDAEIPSVIYSTFSELGLGNFIIKINNRKLLTGLISSLGITNLSKEVLNIIDKKEKIGSDAMEDNLLKLGLSKDKVEEIINFTEIEGKSDEVISKLKKLKIQDKEYRQGVEDIETVSNYISKFGVPEDKWCIDLSIARGLDYYTGTVYETILTEFPTIGSVCSGGRYDNLAEYYTDRKLPGVGVSIGLTRLFYQLKEASLIMKEKTGPAEILVLPLTDDMTIPLKVASYLRNRQIPTHIYLESSHDFRKKFSYARDMKFDYVIMIGEDEIKNKTFTVKDMNKRTQESYPLENLDSFVRIIQ